MFPTKVSLVSLAAVVVIACSGSSNNGIGNGDAGVADAVGSVDAGGAEAAGNAGFAGVYNATFTGNFQNTSPNTDSGTTTSTATITVTNVTASEVELSWQVSPNPPSGSAVFQMTGSTGTLDDSSTSVADAGENACFTGDVSGNTQTNCCTACTVSFSGNTFSQPNSGHYVGTTPEGVAYAGTYSGTWTGTRQ
jgi:hypothetical protein